MHRKPDWLDLPSDVTANILFRVGVVDILENAQKVCTAWHKICKEPAMWRVIHMDFYDGSIPEQELSRKTFKKICKHAVDRSQGQLVDVRFVGFVIDELLLYVADRSSQLRRLEIAFCTINTIENWTKALMKFPLLEELGFYTTIISRGILKTVARCCPMLKTLKLNQERTRNVISSNEDEFEVNQRIHNMKAILIGEMFFELKHLELIGSRMTNSGLRAILDGCFHLESLDLRQCLHIDLKGDIGERCSKQIKFLKLPDESLKNCPYNYTRQLLPGHCEAFLIDRSQFYFYFTSDSD